ncbi:MAG TPA: copper-binding protein [Ramlibacter sp.]|nr:copper-binding protein [Ramlibacter sp.]
MTQRVTTLTTPTAIPIARPITARILQAALAALLVGAALIGAVQAQTAGAALDSAMTEGEVRKVDAENQKITLKHEAIKNLDMPPMTMVFQVNDPALLGKVKAGDKVRFKAAHEGGKYIVTGLEARR